MGDRERGIFRRAGLSAALACVAATGAVAGAAASVSAVRGTTLGSEKVKPGKVLDVAGRRAVYLFSKDSATKSACNGTCAKTWQPVLAVGKVTLAPGSGLRASLLGKVKRSDGHMQLTYGHHPLYLFSGDRAGTVKGEGAATFGGHWYLVGTGGSAVRPRGGGACNPLCQSY